MSFIDLFANDIWSEYDIVRRTEAMVRKEFSLEAETILNRKVLGMTTGSYEATPEDLAEIDKYTNVVLEAREAGNAARADMKLLLKVFGMEKAKARLDKPVVDDPNDPAISQKDLEERDAAQLILDSAEEPERNLFALRNPDYLNTTVTTNSQEGD